MKKTKLFLLCTMTIPLLMTACGDTDNTNDVIKNLSPEVREYIDEISLNDERLTGELENKTVKWLATWDINPDTSTGKNVPIDFAVFQERYGGEIEYYEVSYDERYEKLAQYIRSGEGIDFFSGIDMDAFPKGAIKDMFVPVDDYIDFSSPLWEDVKEVNDSFMWNNQHYLTAVSVSGDNCAVIYNKSTVAEAGLQDPLELFEKGEWNWNTFEDMLNSFVDEDNERYGIDGWWFESALIQTTGVPAISIEDGKIVNNLASPEMERVQNFMYRLSIDGNIAIGSNAYGWNDHPEYIGEGKLLFYPCGLWKLYMTADKWQAVFGEDMAFVPMPKDPESDEYYIPVGMNSYLFVKDGDNPEGVAKYLDCKRYVLLTQELREISDQQMTDDYGWTEEMVNMKNTMDEMALENPNFDFYKGVTSDIADILDSRLRESARGTAWNETFDSIYSTIQTLIDEVNSD